MPRNHKDPAMDTRKHTKPATYGGGKDSNTGKYTKKPENRTQEDRSEDKNK